MKIAPDGYIHMLPHELTQMLSAAATLGGSEAIRLAGLDKSQITKAQAYKRFDRWRVDRWIREYKIRPVKQGGNVYLDLHTLETLSKTDELAVIVLNTNINNRLSVGERKGEPSGKGRKTNAASILADKNK